MAPVGVGGANFQFEIKGEVLDSSPRYSAGTSCSHVESSSLQPYGQATPAATWFEVCANQLSTAPASKETGCSCHAIASYPCAQAWSRNKNTREHSSALPTSFTHAPCKHIQVDGSMLSALQCETSYMPAANARLIVHGERYKFD